MDVPTVFADQKIRRVKCCPGTAIVSPHYPMKNLAELALDREDAIRPDWFAEWHCELRRHATHLVERPPWMNPHIPVA